MTSSAPSATLARPSASHPTDLPTSAIQRQTMVDCQIRTFDVTDQRLIARCLVVPRERFVPDGIRDLAYSDIGFTLKPATSGDEVRYLLPPLILARMIQGARVKHTDRVLDVACGTGYSTAILAGLAHTITALEANADLSADAGQRLSEFGLDHIVVRHGDLTAGAPGSAPFDVIIVNGAVETNLESLQGQLAEGGRLVVIERRTGDPTGRAAKVVCYENRGGAMGARYLFDASAPVLSAFREPPRFVF